MQKSREEFERIAQALVTSLLVWLGEATRDALTREPTNVWLAVQVAQAQGLIDAYNASIHRMAEQLLTSTADFLEVWRRRVYAHPSSLVPWQAWRETPTMAQLVNSAITDLDEALTIVSPNSLYLKLRDTSYIPFSSALDKLTKDAHVMVTNNYSYQQAIRYVTDELATVGGVKINVNDRDYDLYGYVRSRVYNDWSRLNQALRYQDGIRAGMDGVEVSAHWDCAPDHLPYQGHVYSKEEFEVIQGSLERPIGDGYNCRHLVYPCWLDSTSSYSQEDLDEYARQATEIVDVGGHERTRYEATQWQRGQERRVRDWKTKAQMCDALGDTEKAAKCRHQAQSIQRALKQMCDEVGLRYDARRMQVGRIR